MNKTAQGKLFLIGVLVICSTTAMFKYETIFNTQHMINGVNYDVGAVVGMNEGVKNNTGANVEEEMVMTSDSSTSDSDSSVNADDDVDADDIADADTDADKLKNSEEQTTRNEHETNQQLEKQQQQQQQKQERKLRYCELGSNRTTNDIDECYNLLSPHMGSKPAWHFMGDSQMGVVSLSLFWNNYPYTIPKDKHNIKIAAERCGFVDYCGPWLEKRGDKNQWMIQGAGKTQGPFIFGLRHPFCSDLSHFKNTRIETIDVGVDADVDVDVNADANNADGHNDTDVAANVDIDVGVDFGTGSNVTVVPHKYSEYLVVEYASDVEQQTNTTNTTQQSVTLYMEQELKHYNLTTSDSVCVVNTGIHDQHICYNKTEANCLDIYRRNVQEYLRLLDRVCGNIVWISTTPVRGDVTQIQDSNRTVEWNKAVMSLLGTYYAEKSFYLDTWKRGLNHDHKDNIHFKEPYYTALVELFVKLIKY